MLLELILAISATGADGIGSRPIPSRAPTVERPARLPIAGPGQPAATSSPTASVLAPTGTGPAPNPSAALPSANPGSAAAAPHGVTGPRVTPAGIPARAGTRVVESAPGPAVDDRFAGLPYVPARRSRGAKWPRHGGAIVTRNYRYEGGRIFSPTDLNGLGGGPGTDPGRRDTFLVVLPPLYDGWFVIPR